MLEVLEFSLNVRLYNSRSEAEVMNLFRNHIHHIRKHQKRHIVLAFQWNGGWKMANNSNLRAHESVETFKNTLFIKSKFLTLVIFYIKATSSIKPSSD